MPKPFEIARTVRLQATPDEVWRAISSNEGLACWFMPSPMEPSSDMATVWEPGRQLVIETPPGDDGSMHAFEYLIEAEDGGTAVLRFVHRGFLGDDWSDEFEPMTGHGWDMYLATLAAYCEHFGGRPGAYIEAEGPASSADASCWPKLLAAVPTAPVTGVVDYEALTFLGIRTDDALVRFHGRWLIGMPVAVSHHAYGPDTDVAAWTKTWTEWLAAVL